MDSRFYSKNQIVLLVAFVILIAVFVFVRAYVGGNDWRYTHWLFSYDYEFVKRGLIGEFLNVFEFEKNIQSIEAVWHWIVIFLTIIFMYFLVRLIDFNKSDKGMFLFILVGITSSATIQHYVYDLGRFDSINFVMTMLSLFLIEKYPNKLTYLIILIIGSLMLLVHEAAFFMYLPMIIGFWIYRSPDALKEKILIFFVMAALTLAISINGKVEHMSFVKHYEALTAQYGSSVSKSSLYVLHRNVDDNIEFTVNSINEKRLVDHIAFFLTFLPLFLLFKIVLLKIKKNRQFNWKITLVLISCFTPLLLYPLGEDHFRWWAVSISNLFIALALLAHNDESIRIAINDVFQSHKKLIVLCILFSILLGPLGNPSAYPHTLNQFILLYTQGV